MGKKKLYDTCSLLAEIDNDDLFAERFYISSISLHELENIKTSKSKTEDVRYKARKLSHLLDEHYNDYDVIVYSNQIADYITNKLGLDATVPDNQIVGTARFVNESEDIIFVTNDICLKNIARAIELDVCSVENNSLDEYKGFIEKSLSEEDMAYFYEHLQENIFDLYTNEYLILKNDKGEVVDTLKWDGEMYEAVRCKPFKSNMFGTLKPLDEIQSCAMDSINCNNITVLYGKAGSGKTTLPLNYIMQGLEKAKFKKLYIIYSFEPLKGAKTLGFEKGDHVTKLLYSASIGNILASKFGDISQVEYMIDRQMIDIIPTANIRGVEFEEDSIVLCTESQNLDVYTLKTIIQRCKEGCKQIYEGDIIEQKDTDIQQVGINRLIEVFKGNKSFGCVKLKNNYRSPLCELADLM